MTYFETIYKIWCYGCNSPNFLNNGDVSDITKNDLSPAFKCHECGLVQLIGWDSYDDIDKEHIFGTTSREEALKNYEIGLKKEEL